MTKKSHTWIPRAEKDTDMVGFDFPKFFEDIDTNLDQIAKILDYSTTGTKRMILRGRIKRRNLEKLKTSLDAKSIYNFVKP